MISIPNKMYTVRQNFNKHSIDCVESEIENEIRRENIISRIIPGSKVGILVGSRGISCIDKIVAEIVRQIKHAQATPVIIPSMGSHGQATAEGQRHILSNYGITESTMNCDIESSMDVTKTGSIAGIDIYVDSIALSCDYIIPVGRIKSHTDFRGPVESGLCKMLSIGVGNQIGCTNLHKAGFYNFHWLIPEVARINIDSLKVIFGIAIIENAYNEPYIIKAIPAEDILSQEPQLLKIAKSIMPKIRLKRIDLLIIDEIGKDISGCGMDPNITGRTWCGELPDFDGPKIERIFVNGLTENTDGNACGIGYADFISQECIKSINIESTKINALASRSIVAGKIPLPINDDEIYTILDSIPNIDMSAPKIVRIKNTLSLTEIQVSESLLNEIVLDKDNEILDD